MSSNDPKKARSSKVVNAPISSRRTIPISSYDFLHGEFKKTSRARIFAFGMILLLIMVFSYFLLQGYLGNTKVTNFKKSAQDNRTKRLQVITSLGVVTKFQDVSAEQVLKRTRDITVSSQDAAISEPDMFAILGKLRDIAQPGVIYNTITFCSTDPSGGSCGPNDKAPKGRTVSNVHYILVSISTSDFNAAAQWYANFKNINWFLPISNSEKHYIRNGSGIVAWAQIVDNLVPLDTKNALAQVGMMLSSSSTPPDNTGGNNAQR